jgi:hypothetical protein
VDKNWNSAYPYAVGPTFYGLKTAAKVTSISETVTSYTGTTTGIATHDKELSVTVFPNPGSDFIAVQLGQLNSENIHLSLLDAKGQQVRNSIIYQGSTITYLDIRTLYDGVYFLHLQGQAKTLDKKIVIAR